MPVNFDQMVVAVDEQGAGARPSAKWPPSVSLALPLALWSSPRSMMFPAARKKSAIRRRSQDVIDRAIGSKANIRHVAGSAKALICPQWRFDTRRSRTGQQSGRSLNR